MTENRPKQTSHNKPESWRVERMVQPVPAHLGEEPRFSPWLVVGALAALVIVAALWLIFSGSISGSIPAEATTAPKPRTTIIHITATPITTPTKVLSPTPVTIKYTVKQGDTLSSISQKFQVSIEAIRAVNNLVNDTIRAGDEINIPQSAVPPPPSTPSARVNSPPTFKTPTLIAFLQASTPVTPTTPTPTPGVVSYTVKTGDTLLTIASAFGTTVQAIMEQNKLSGPNIRAGQTLTVPVGVWIPTVAAAPAFAITPTATATPSYAYQAPDLIYPSDGADFAHDAKVTLQWLAPGKLRGDEYYVVHLSYLASGVEQNLPSYAVNQGNLLTLENVPVSRGTPTQFWWYVVVVRESGCGPAAPAAAQPCAVSLMSEKRSFTWR